MTVKNRTGRNRTSFGMTYRCSVENGADRAHSIRGCVKYGEHIDFNLTAHLKALAFMSRIMASNQIVYKTEFGRLMGNCNYRVIDSFSARAVIINPTFGTVRIEQAFSQAKAALDDVPLTQAYADHIELANPLSAKHGCPIWFSIEEIEASAFSAPKLVGTDETASQIGCLKTKPLLTPEHTVGCICYLIGENLFGGHVLFVEGRGICPDIDAAYQIYDSLQVLKWELKPRTRAFSGVFIPQAPKHELSKCHEGRNVSLLS